MIAAGFASCWPHGGAWPLPTGLGGVVGDALVRAPAVVFGPAGFVYRLVLGVILFAAMVRGLPVRQRLGLAAARGQELTPIEDDDEPFVEEEGGSRFGLAGLAVPRHDEREGAARLVAHDGLSLAGLSSQPGAAARFERQEPNLGGRARAVAGAAKPGRGFDEETKRTKTRRRKPRSPARRARRPRRASRKKSSDKFELPSVSVLVGAESLRPAAAQQGRAGSQFARAGRRAAAISASAAKSSRPIRARS